MHDIDPVVGFADWFVNGVAVLGVHEQSRRDPPGFEGMVPFHTLRARHALVLSTDGQQRGGANLTRQQYRGYAHALYPWSEIKYSEMEL